MRATLCTPVVRSARDVLSRGDENNEGRSRERPKTRAKWLIASVVEDARKVVAKVFDEAQRRDPEQRRQWVVLVDGLTTRSTASRPRRTSAGSTW
jgi:hypothetical protein